MAQENPYAAIVDTMKSVNRGMRRSPWAFGLVVSKSPLVIRYGDQTLSGEDLRVNYHLVPGHREHTTLRGVTGGLDASVDCPEGSITHIDVHGGTVEAEGVFGGVLEAGDRVAMLCSEDQQVFVVLCKVVDAW